MLELQLNINWYVGKAVKQTTTFITYSFLLGRSLLLWCSLLLRRSLLGLGCLLGLILVGSAELVRSLGLDKFTIGHGLLQGFQIHAIHPLLIGWEVGLHVLLDGDGGGAGAVLELGDGFDDSCFVRHG